MQKKILLTLLLAIFILEGQNVYACTCGKYAPINNGDVEFNLKEWLKEFDGAFFTGQVTIIEKIKVRLHDEYIPELKVTFRVDRFWKGVNSANTIIYTGAGCCDCGVRYVRGKKYFVIADNINGNLRTNICTSPEKYEEVYDYIKQLGEGEILPPPRPKASHDNRIHRTPNVSN